MARTIAFTVRGPIARSDLPGLCDRICALLASSSADLALCDVDGIEPDAVTVDALARLQLAARRYGCRVALRGASVELRGLVTFMGLEDVLVDAVTQPRAPRPALHEAGPASARGAGGARSAGTAAPCRGRT